MKRRVTKYPSNYIRSSYDRAEIIQQRVPHIIDWGESMYGGYFFNYIGEDKEVNGCHADSIKELEAQANSLGFTLKGAKRFDNTSGPLGWDLDDVEGSTKAVSSVCYIDNYDKWVKPVNVLENIMDMANRCLQGSGLSVPDIDSIGIADNGQLLGFYHLYKTKSGNWYSIGWQGGEWKLFIYDDLPAENLHWLADAMDEINNTFNGIRFHEDRPII